MLPAAWLDWTALILFCAGFASFLIFESHRHWLAFAAALLVVMLGLEGPLEALKAVNWKIVVIFFTTLAAAEVFMISGAAAVAAEAILARFRSPAIAIMALVALTGFLSLFVENVACVLIAAPIAISLAHRLKLRPQPVLVGCALTSNLQGCGLLIGDPPSMLLAAQAKMTFLDFIWYDGKPSIFFAVQAGAIAGGIFLWFIFRKYHGTFHLHRTAKLIGWAPTALLVLLIGSLAVGTQIEQGIGWGAAGGCAFFAGLSVVWLWRQTKKRRAHKESAEQAMWEHEIPTVGGYLKGLDWKTTLFIISVFVPVSILEKYGWIESLGTWIVHISAGSSVIAFAILVLAAMIASAFVDNIPFLLVMLPAVMAVGNGLGMANPIFLYFGLLLGTSVGGNITPIGAQANVAAVGLLRKHGAPVTLKEYFSLSVPYTMAAVAASCLFVYLLYGPK